MVGLRKTVLVILLACGAGCASPAPTEFRYMRSAKDRFGFYFVRPDPRRFRTLYNVQFVGSQATSHERARDYVLLAGFRLCAKSQSMMYLVRPPERFEHTFQPPFDHKIEVGYRAGLVPSQVQVDPQEGNQKVGMQMLCLKRFQSIGGLGRVRRQDSHVVVDEIYGEKSPFQVGDVIQKINSTPIEQALEVLTVINESVEPDSEVQIERKGKPQTLKVWLVEESNELRSTLQESINQICRRIPEGDNHPCRPKPPEN